MLKVCHSLERSSLEVVVAQWRARRSDNVHAITQSMQIVITEGMEIMIVIRTCRPDHAYRSLMAWFGRSIIHASAQRIRDQTLTITLMITF